MSTKILTPIIPFDLLIDIDVGIIRMINDKYHNEEVFYKGIMEAPIKQLIYFLYNRENKNPLSILCDLDNKIIDTYYNQFIDSEYEFIVKYSIPTNLLDLWKLYSTSEAIRPYVLCKNDIQKYYINKLIKNYSTIKIIEGDIKDIDPSIYDPIYFKYYEDTIKLMNKLKANNIYIANYKFNFSDYENRILNKDISEVILFRNQATITDVYRIDDSYIPLG